MKRVAVILAVLVLGSSAAAVPKVVEISTPPPPVPTVTAPPLAQRAPVVLAAGDIARCEGGADERVAALIEARDGVVLTLGDHAYPDGSVEQFEECYDPAWGPLRHRTRPAIGNHEYKTDDAAPYFDYFGAVAGHPEQGFYAFDLGPHWRAIALNSNCDRVDGGCDEGWFDVREAEQVAWLVEELATHADKNILAYWHHPMFSSGYHGNTDNGARFWELLYEAGADVVLTAHDHHYERFAPHDGSGEVDHETGMRQFLVGTGGGAFRAFSDPPLPGTEVRNDGVHGVLKLELRPSSYRWEFLPAAGHSFTDTGEQAVRQAPSDG